MNVGYHYPNSRKQQGKAGINIDSNKWHNLHSWHRFHEHKQVYIYLDVHSAVHITHKDKRKDNGMLRILIRQIEQERTSTYHKKKRAKQWPVTHKKKGKNDMLRGTLVRQLQQKATLTYHRKIVQGNRQSQKSKKLICYEKADQIITTRDNINIPQKSCARRCPVKQNRKRNDMLTIESDRCNRRERPHTTRGSCKAVSSHTTAEKLIC